MVWTQDSERVYSGTWERDTMSGHGHMWWSDTGTVYTGHWRHGAMHGHGDVVWGPRSQHPHHQFSGQFRFQFSNLNWFQNDRILGRDKFAVQQIRMRNTIMKHSSPP